MNQLLDHARHFNSMIIFLAKAYVSKKDSNKKTTNAEKQKAYRDQKRISIICKEDIFFMIKRTGPYLIKYAQLIKEKKWEEFAKKNYDEDIKNENKEIQQTAGEYIMFFKEIYGGCNKAEKKVLEDTITDMLSIYCQYALCVKRME